MENGDKTPSLQRVISMPQLIFYGLGTMIGGGIYALTGKVAGVAGFYAPISFVLSAILALLSALSYAELSTRFPFSAGAAQYVRAAFDKKLLTRTIGWLLIFTGAVSAAALCNATAGFVNDMTGLPQGLLVVLLVILMGGIAAWGITESVAVVVTITLIEIAGLLLVIAVSGQAYGQIGARIGEFIPPLHDTAIWAGILGGTFLAFYAFIGFEDLVNVAEEVKDAERVMPWTIIICVGVTMVIYLLIVLAAILSVPIEDLAESKTPLATIVEKNGSSLPPSLFSVISMLATINGALVQIVMGARVLYGMAQGGEAPSILGKVHAVTRTPLAATLAMTVVILILATVFDLTMLAKIASAIVLFIFIAVNASLLRLKWGVESVLKKSFSVPIWVPVLGFVSSIALLIHEIVKYF